MTNQKAAVSWLRDSEPLFMWPTRVVCTPLSSAPISRALGRPAVERLREDTVLDETTCAMTCARQNPAIVAPLGRWRCGGGGEIGG